MRICILVAKGKYFAIASPLKAQRELICVHMLEDLHILHIKLNVQSGDPPPVCVDRGLFLYPESTQRA